MGRPIFYETAEVHLVIILMHGLPYTCKNQCDPDKRILTSGPLLDNVKREGLTLNPLLPLEDCIMHNEYSAI